MEAIPSIAPLKVLLLLTSTLMSPSRTLGSPIRVLSTSLRAQDTTATLTTLYQVLIELPVGGQPSGSWIPSPFWLRAPTPGLEWSPSNTNPYNVKPRVGINSSCTLLHLFDHFWRFHPSVLRWEPHIFTFIEIYVLLQSYKRDFFKLLT